MVRVYRVRAYACDDPALQLAQPKWQELSEATVRECIRLSEDPTVEASLKMPIDLIFSRRINISKPGAKLKPEVSDAVNGWVDEVRMIMYHLDTFGLAVAVVGVDEQPAAVWLNAVKLQYYYTQDQMLTFRLILPKTMEEMSTISASNPVYGNVFTTRQNALKVNRSQARKKRPLSPSSRRERVSKIARAEHIGEQSAIADLKKQIEEENGDGDDDDDDDKDDRAKNAEYTERERVDRARFYLFVSRKPNPDPLSGGVNSKVRTIASSESFANKMVNATLVASTDAARTTAAVETAERKIDGSDPNLDVDFAMPGDRNLVRDADFDAANHNQHVRVMEQTAVAESLFSQTTARMAAADYAVENQDLDSASKMRTRPNIRIRVDPAVRLLVLPPGTTLKPVPAAQIPTVSLEVALGTFSTDVANMSGVPASLMSADGSRTNMNVTEAQWHRFWVTCLERDQIARTIIETFFHDIYGEQTYEHAVHEAGKAHALRQVQKAIDSGVPEEDLSEVVNKQVYNLQKLHGFMQTYLTRGNHDASRMDSRRAKRAKHSHDASGVTSLGVDARAAPEGESGEADDNHEGDDDDNERLPNVDDFEPFQDDSFHLDVAKFKKITVSFLGSLDPFTLLSYQQMGLIKYEAVKEFVLKGIHNIPEEFLPNEPLDPTTGSPAAEMYLGERQAQEKQFKQSLEAKAQGGDGGSGAGGASKGLGSGAHPSAATNKGAVFGQGDRFGQRPSRFDTRVTHSSIDDKKSKKRDRE